MRDADSGSGSSKYLSFLLVHNESKNKRKDNKKAFLAVKYNRPLHPDAEINLCITAYLKM